jgi:hypothetical protein
MPRVAPTLKDLLARLATDYPQLSFAESTQFSWHPGKQHISYQNVAGDTTEGIFSLLHEMGHALLAHKNYKYDVELLKIEVAAWDKARMVAQGYDIELNEDHIQDCLDTYRDWLHLRATCPSCYGRSLQASTTRYNCFNCQTEWTVTASRLCRPYRLQQPQKTS